MPYRWYQANRDSIQRSCQTSSAGRPSIVSSGLTKNSISICSNSRVRKMKLPGVISLRKALPIWAIPNGSFSRIDCSTLSKLTKMPCAVSGRKYVTAASSSTGPMNVLNIRLNCRGVVSSPLPQSGQRLRRTLQCLHGSPAGTSNLLPLVAGQ